MECEIPLNNADDEKLIEILNKYKNIAVVGLSGSQNKDSYRVAKYLMGHGYNIIPVNPNREHVLGKRSYPKLTDITETVDIVCIFRPSEDIPPIVDQAIKINAKVVWMQLGIVNNLAGDKALQNGLDLVMNKCMKVEHHRLAGQEINI